MPKSWLPGKNLIVLLPIIAVLTAGPALAQDHRDATVGFYLQEAQGYPNCGDLDPPSCADGDILLTGEIYGYYYAFLCVFNGNVQIGVAAVQCAIEFDDIPGAGVDIDAWQLCTNGLEFPHDGWGQISGDGNRITWDATAGGCQTEEPGGFGTGVTAVAGFFYVTAYSEDLLQVVPWEAPSGGVLPSIVVGDCGDDTSTGRETTLEAGHAGSVGFSDDGSVVGDLPCLQRVQEETTWGSVKDLYNNQ